MAHRRELLPLVAEWFAAEWPSWYGPGGPGDVCQDLAAFASSDDKLPVGMIAFEDHLPVGAGALKATSIPSHLHLGPWAAAGYVVPPCRGRGIGAELLQVLVAKANLLGFEHVYCGTSTSQSLLTRAGWLPIEVTLHDDKPLTVFRSAAHPIAQVDHQR